MCANLGIYCIWYQLITHIFLNHYRRTDLPAQGEVTQKDITDFENQWRIPVHTINNLSGFSQDSKKELDDAAAILNHLCQALWRRDRVLVEQAESRHEGRR